MKTMFSRILLAPALSVAGLLLMGAAAGADTWQVSEGPGGKTTGVWTVRIVGTDITGDATMTTPDKKTLKYAFTGKVDGRSFTINRVKPSDDNLCTYTGSAPSGGSSLRKVSEINGSAMCQQKTGVWKVRAMATGK